MQEYLVQGSLNLTRSSVLRVEDGRDILIYVWEGELWITEEHERGDRIVRRGEWHRISRNGAALCYALQRSVVTLTAPQPEGYARRILVQRAGTSVPEALYDPARERGLSLRARLRHLFAGFVRPIVLRVQGA
ncbi:MAG TPA: hypothetical protein VFV84_10735 [Burkholderiales bacterium]|nr:hypothetical protein [Burkholderiales bacterium]